MEHTIAIILAYVIDLMFGDPHNKYHPVRWFGQLVYFLEQRFNRGKRKRLKGTFMLIVLVMVTLLISIGIVIFFYQIHLFFGIVIEALLISMTIAQKTLKKASLSVFHPLHNGDLIEARTRLSHIVGRDTENLSEREIVRGTVETVAENTSDGITAPLFWAFIGGAPLALVYRAINTCDSMVGYQNERYREFGWASAKLDDLINYFPARITAFLMLVVNKRRDDHFFRLWRYITIDAKKHASPNSGWLEATIAYILHIELGGDNFYSGVKKSAQLIGSLQNDHVPLQKEHILQTNAIMQRTIFAMVVCIVIGGIIIDFTIAWL